MRSNRTIIFRLLTILVISLLTACSIWEDYYGMEGDEPGRNLWESIKEVSDFSSFVTLVEDHSLDTLFESNNAYTLFVPTNKGLDTLDLSDTDPEIFILSHIVQSSILLRNAGEETKLKTLSGKFALLECDSTGYSFNMVPITSQSELHSNGLYYTLDGGSKPLDNLYQYVERVNPSLAAFIASQDTVYLDLELSKPVDINEYGEIVYDSVMIRMNLFELMYFPLSEEFRENRATLAIPTGEQYQQALDQIKSDLNLDPEYDIPTIWQEEVLMPYILDQGIFEGMLGPEAFEKGRLKNIKGDSVSFSYSPQDPSVCSNGLAYHYDAFDIPDSLYLAGYRMEGESLIEPKGLGLYTWKDPSVVRLYGETSFAPEAQQVRELASNDSILYVNMGTDFNGDYAIEFKIENVFPGSYQCIWRSNPRAGGIYSVYINGELQELPFGFTEFDLKYLSGGVVSVTGSQYFYPVSGYNMLDCLTTIEEFGDVWIRIEYKGSGQNTDNGLIIDYVELVPYAE